MPSRLLGLVAVGLLLLAAFTPLPNLAHRRFVESSPYLGPAQAIVVLGAGATDDYLTERSLRRAIQGIRLYHRGLAPVLVMHGGGERHSSPESANRARLAADLGVPAKALLLAGGRTTREEAEQAWAHLSPRGAVRILLVTGSHHMPRAHALFRRQGFDVRPAAVDEVALGSERPEQRLSLARSLLQEGMARLVYTMTGRI